jgi:hypothetical protein
MKGMNIDIPVESLPTVPLKVMYFNRTAQWKNMVIKGLFSLYLQPLERKT